MVVGIVDHQTGTRDIRATPAARPAAGGRSTVVAPSSARRRWPASRCCSGFVAKEAAYAAFDRRRVLGERRRARRDRRRLDADRRLQRPVRVGALVGRRRRTRGTSPRPDAPAGARPPAVGFVAPGRACSPSLTIVLGVAPRLARPPRRRRRRSPSTASGDRCTSRCGTASTCALVLSAVTLAGGAVAVRSPRRPVARLLALGRRDPDGDRGLPRPAARPQPSSPTG